MMNDAVCGEGLWFGELGFDTLANGPVPQELFLSQIIDHIGRSGSSKSSHTDWS